MIAIGIDLAGKEKNETGLAVLADLIFEVFTVHSDEEILEMCRSESPDIVAVDSPLSVPRDKGYRDVDLSLIHEGYRVLPPKFDGMKCLTERGTKLAKKLEGFCPEVVEVHPRTSGKILFGSDSREDWLSGISEGEWHISRDYTEHEVDAAVSALTGFLHQKGKSETVSGEEGEIVIPSDCL